MPVSNRAVSQSPTVPITSHSEIVPFEYTDSYGAPPAHIVSHLASKIASAPRPHSNDDPLWAGPCGSGPLGGITQSMLVRFLSCRERFRLKYVLGLEPHDKWYKTLGYGNMWHTCEESHAAIGEDWGANLATHVGLLNHKYPLQREEIEKWYRVCMVQFPEYVKYWSEHSDVKNRVPLEQEQVFDIPYTLPSGRVVRLRGKRDSTDQIEVDGKLGVWLQENKSKGDIEKEDIERQLKFDLQTNLYLIALRHEYDKIGWAAKGPLRGVRYNVVRRPLSGGKGNIKPHEGKCTKPVYSKRKGQEHVILHESKITPAETADTIAR